jgi:hypothetical protein
MAKIIGLNFFLNIRFINAVCKRAAGYCVTVRCGCLMRPVQYEWMPFYGDWALSGLRFLIAACWK